MDNKPRLVLPTRFEEVVTVLGNDEQATRLQKFVEPVIEAERQLSLVTQSIQDYSSGKIVFLLGAPGIGKSTFIESLKWRPWLSIPQIRTIDAIGLDPSDEKLIALHQQLQDFAIQQPTGRKGLLTVVVNYLENFEGISDSAARSFFRDVNGLLRRYPLLIVWPVTENKAVQQMIDQSQSVSDTIFTDEPVLDFKGPPIDKFAEIARKTILTLNPGRTLADFQLAESDLQELLDRMKQHHQGDHIIATYLRWIRKRWVERTGETKRILESIPKATEVWFLICYPEAENVVERFARKIRDPDLAWRTDPESLTQYTSPGTRQGAKWPKERLLQATAAFQPKVMFLPTHTLVGCAAHFGRQLDLYDNEDSQFKSLVDNVSEAIKGTQWNQKSRLLKLLETTPLVRQLKGEEAKIGSRRGRSPREDIAKEAFKKINDYISREGSDQPINRCLALALRTALGPYNITAEKVHPWLGNLRPDLIDTDSPDKIICIEMYYTMDVTPSNLAYYLLRKLDEYMRELSAYIAQPPLPHILSTD